MMHSSPVSTGVRRNESSGLRPSPVTESSLLETVGSFLNEVQTISSDPLSDPKIQVTWARFEMADANDPSLHGHEPPPLLLILGYTSGVQVWSIPSSSGEAVEVLSRKHFTLKTLRILPSPIVSPEGRENDNYAHLRPLIVLSELSGSGIPFSAASFISLKTGEEVHNIKFSSEISDIVVNRQVVIMLFKEKLAVFNARNLEALFTISSCFPSPGVDVNPIALGDRWLAYADKKMMPVHRSFGGMEMEGGQSVTAWGINVGSKLAKGVSKIYSNIFSSTGNARTTSLASSSNPSSSSSNGNIPSNEPHKGIVTVLDVLRVGRTEGEELNVADNLEGIVAHFIAHNKAIVAMKFDASASLLLTCDRPGNYFNIFRIIPHPAGSCYSAVHHLYSLYRGDTPGSVQDIAFSSDSRWVAVSTLRGTTHIFPITPYGGPVGVRTHTSHRVVNRLSRFHRSAGIEHPASNNNNNNRRRNASGRNSPNPGSSPGASPLFNEMSTSPHTSSSLLALPYPNPHLGPFPSPTLVQPLAQLRQPYLLSSLQQLGGSVSKKTGGSASSSSSSSFIGEDVPIRLACTFAPSRAWLIGSQHNMFTRMQRNKHMDSLFVMANHGVLLEYTLDPIPESTLPKEKICESSPIELQIVPYGQWTLSKPKERAELQPPLSPENPLMIFPPNNNERQHRRGGGSGSWSRQQQQQPKDTTDQAEEEDNDQWLSQVEILTHIGPHRRLWMGPQFSFKTLHPVAGGETDDEFRASDINLQPQPSHPLSCTRTVPVLIEAGSASSSFELSPRFHNFHIKRSESQLDLESELHEAMAESILEEEGNEEQSTTQGGGSKVDSGAGKEEEFFCLTPDEDHLSKGGSRSRNASAASHDSSKIHQLMSSAMTISNQISDTKIFSVAVESRRASHLPSSSSVAIEDSRLLEAVKVEPPEYSSNFAIVSSKPADLQTAETRELTPCSSEEQGDLISLSNESVDMLSEAISSVVEPLKTAQHNEVSTLVVEDEDHEEDDEDEFFISEKKSIEDSPSPEPSRAAWDSFLQGSQKTSVTIMKDIEHAQKKYSDDIGEADKQQCLSSYHHRNNHRSLMDSSEDEVPLPSARRLHRRKKKGSNERAKETEGWSFEDDDLDFHKLLSEMEEGHSSSQTLNPSSSSCLDNLLKSRPDPGGEEDSASEKVSLDEVFKFDSETRKEEASVFHLGGGGIAPASLEIGASSNYDSTEDTTGTTSGGAGSSSAFVGGSTSESSVGNSPNVKKGKKRNKKKRGGR